MRIFSFERQLRRKNLAQIIEENRIKIVISPMLKGPAFSFEQVLFRKKKLAMRTKSTQTKWDTA